MALACVPPPRHGTNAQPNCTTPAATTTSATRLMRLRLRAYDATNTKVAAARPYEAARAAPNQPGVVTRQITRAAAATATASNSTLVRSSRHGLTTASAIATTIAALVTASGP